MSLLIHEEAHLLFLVTSLGAQSVNLTIGYGPGSVQRSGHRTDIAGAVEYGKTTVQTDLPGCHRHYRTFGQPLVDRRPRHDLTVRSLIAAADTSVAYTKLRSL